MIVFTPSPSPGASLQVTPGIAPTTSSLPPPDQAAPELAITNGTDQVVWLAWGSGAAVGPGCAGCITLPPHRTQLYTTNPAALAAGAGNRDVIPSQAHANAITLTTLAATGTAAALTIARGSILLLSTFATAPA